MSLLHVKNRNRDYFLELDMHLSNRKTEMPVEKLGAVFLETAGGHPNTSHEIAKALNKHAVPFKMDKLIVNGTVKRMQDIVKRAEKNGTELWLGDIAHFTPQLTLLLAGGMYGGEEAARIAAGKMTRRKSLQIILATLGGAAGASTLSGIAPGMLLSREGDANKRPISREAVTLASGERIRNQVMAHKINTLSEITGHRRIGVYTGAFHVGIADILEKGPLKREIARKEIGEYGADALKMYRCRYDKTVKQWQVEEHNL